MSRCIYIEEEEDDEDDTDAFKLSWAIIKNILMLLRYDVL